MAWKKQENASFWKPEVKGEEQIGIVKEIRKDDKFGESYVIEQDDTKDLVVTPSHKVLQNRMRGVKVGDKVKIVYQGQDLPKVKGHNPTSMYEVYLDK
jgi:hypothetical protein